MAKATKRKSTEKKPMEITFKCRRCQRQMPLDEMRVVTRFFPLMVVCRFCETEIR